MKAHILAISMLLFLVMTTGCTSGVVGAKATGVPYEVIVVMDHHDWQGDIGNAIKDDLYYPVPGLPQIEPSMKVTYVKPSDFNGLFTYVRNIFILNVDPALYTKVSLKTEENRWVKGQLVVTMNAPGREAILEYAEENPHVLTDIFVKRELERSTALMYKNYSSLVMDNVQRIFGASLNVPDNITYSRDTTDFFWASNNAKTGRIDVVVYSFPYTDPNTFTQDYLIAMRDSVMKANLPGAFPGSYMTTETRIPNVTYTPLNVNGKYVGQLRGLWRMEGDMMGGPFVSHARLDEKNNKVIVAEGFVFAPETNKRNYIRRIEAALYTFRVPEKEIELRRDDELRRDAKGRIMEPR